MQVIADKCLSGKGVISGLAVKDLKGGQGTYAWLNESNDSLANTLNVQNLQQGTYRLKVTDALGCTVISDPVPVTNVNTPLQNPQYDGQTILKNTTATLTVKNYQPGTYELLDNPAATTPLLSNNTGVFVTPALAADKTYYARYINGVCQSSAIAVKVTVVDKNVVYVPNAFTPNGDSRNDILKAVAYGRVKLSYFNVYNRWGQLVFSTTTFNKGWNGALNGKKVDAGVYVWVVKATNEMTGEPIELKGTTLLIE